MDMKDTVTIECGCGSNNFMNIMGKIISKTELLGDYLSVEHNDTNEHVMITMCAECYKVIVMGTAVFNENNEMEDIKHIV
ncbi:MAG: hypothetical protein ACYSTR_02810 [Planctomycetota bacterium]